MRAMQVGMFFILAAGCTVPLAPGPATRSWGYIGGDQGSGSSGGDGNPDGAGNAAPDASGEAGDAPAE
jgi:hypothetical protein